MTAPTRTKRVVALPAAAALSGLMLAALWLLLTPQVARAGGMVGTCNEAGLRQAMAGGGLVTFNCGAPVTITLASQVVITQDTTLDGGTLGLVTINGGDVTRLFTTTTGVTLRVYNLVLFAGNAGAGGGGALNAAGPVVISNSILSSNEGSFSGAIETNSPLTITNSTFDHNAGTQYGGAISTIADLWVTTSVFHHNQATFGLGGAFVVQGTLWVDGSTFYSNTAATSGGAISNYDQGQIRASVFHHNDAGLEGGAIHNIGELMVYDSAVYSNTTDGQGGGLVSSLILRMWDSRVFQNTARTAGGGIFAQASGDASWLTLDDTDVHDNRVTGPSGSGGGLAVEMLGHPADLTRVRIYNNQVLSSTTNAGGGGLAASYYQTVTLRSSAVYSNAAPFGSGGGIYATSGVTLRVYDSAIYDNQASQVGMGGGIFSQYIGIAGSNSLVLSNTTISANFANLGAGVFSDAGNDPAVIEYTTIYSNNGVSGISLVGPAQLHGTVIGRPLPACAGLGQGVFCGAIVAGPTGQNCIGAVTSLGYNLDDDGTCHLSATGDLSDTAALLGPLAWFGGPTPAHAPLTGSPAIDTADPVGCPATDQRGAPRPADGDGVAGARCDKGALELKAIIALLRLPAVFR